jgi:Ras-related C3 botulinum toxin substrate 1
LGLKKVKNKYIKDEDPFIHPLNTIITMALPTCKCVVVGDGTVGKTCLLSVYAKKGFPTKYIPTIFDNYSATVDVDGTPIQLALWDTAGQEEFDSLRPLSYPNSHVFIVCFSVDSITTFHNVRDKWFEDLRKYLAPPQSASVILVGTKADLRPEGTGTQDNFVTAEQAEGLRAEMGAFRYVECSAMKNVNVKTVFDEAIRARFLKEPLALPTPAPAAPPQTTSPARELSHTPAPRDEPPVAPVAAPTTTTTTARVPAKITSTVEKKKDKDCACL